MPAASTKSSRSFLFLAVGIVFLLAFAIGQRGLNEPDEGRYTNIALNFLKPGADLWEPRMSGFGHYDKPPLIYWTTALSFKLFGQNETAARLPCLLGAVLALVGVGWAAMRLYTKEIAWWTVLICGTLGQFWLIGRILTPDMLLTGWCTLAIAAVIESRHRNGHWGFWLLSLLFWTLGWWTKATPVLIPLLGLTVGVLLTKDSKGRIALRPMFLLLGILVLGSGWYLKMIAEHGQLVDFFFIREMKGRVTGHVEGRKGPIYYYLALSFAFWLPWWPMAVRGVVAKWKSWRQSQVPLRVVLGLEGWIVVTGLVIFSLIASKLPAYTLPMAPWAALLFARIIVALKEHVSPRSFRLWTGFSVGTFLVIATAAIIIVPRYESSFRFNSSMREFAQTIKQRNGTVVYADKYWPGMEFYFGPKTFYVVPNDYLFKAKFQQRDDDDGVDPTINEPHFYFPDTWRTSLTKHAMENVWLLHYRKQSPSPFDKFLADPAVQKVALGDFDLVKVDDAAREKFLRSAP